MGRVWRGTKGVGEGDEVEVEVEDCDGPASWESSEGDEAPRGRSGARSSDLEAGMTGAECRIVGRVRTRTEFQVRAAVLRTGQCAVFDGVVELRGSRRAGARKQRKQPLGKESGGVMSALESPLSRARVCRLLCSLARCSPRPCATARRRRRRRRRRRHRHRFPAASGIGQPGAGRIGRSADCAALAIGDLCPAPVNPRDCLLTVHTPLRPSDHL